MYYIYRHVSLLDNSVFYIGKGTLRDKYKTERSRHPRAYEVHGRTKKWNELKSKGYKIDILYYSECSKEIGVKETEFIRLYGRLDIGTGSLVNESFGEGENNKGRVVSFEEKQRYLIGSKNPMFGRIGDKNPFYGKSHNKDFLRYKQLLHSNKVKAIYSDGKTIQFDCVADCAKYFKCTNKNILFRNKQRLKGVKSKCGIFKNIEIIICQK